MHVLQQQFPASSTNRIWIPQVHKFPPNIHFCSRRYSHKISRFFNSHNHLNMMLLAGHENRISYQRQTKILRRKRKRKRKRFSLSLPAYCRLIRRQLNQTIHSYSQKNVDSSTPQAVVTRGKTVDFYILSSNRKRRYVMYLSI